MPKAFKVERMIEREGCRPYPSTRMEEIASYKTSSPLVISTSGDIGMSPTYSSGVTTHHYSPVETARHSDVIHRMHLTSPVQLRMTSSSSPIQTHFDAYKHRQSPELLLHRRGDSPISVCSASPEPRDLSVNTSMDGTRGKFPLHLFKK